MTECEQCKGPLRKLISQSNFHLKGGGWYAGGYGKNPKGSESGDKGGKPASENKDKKKATKPEKKAGSKKKV